MNGAMKATLILIAVVLLGMAASFIWFVSTWDKEAEPALGFLQMLDFGQGGRLV